MACDVLIWAATTPLKRKKRQDCVSDLPRSFLTPVDAIQDAGYADVE
jgi:hypothetical protein